MSHNEKNSCQCTYCDKTFLKDYQLVRHLRVYTSEKPYKCTCCDETL